MYYFIVNPASRSGRGKQNWNIIEDYLCKNRVPYSAHLSKHLGDITNLTRRITRKLDGNSDIMHIIIVGGDGSLNEAVQGICNYDRVRLSYIPTGSGNDFARDLNMSNDPIENLERILKSPQERLMDIGKATYDIGNQKMESRYFAVSCGFGFDAAVCEAVLHSPAKKILNKIGLGKLIYLIQALKLLIHIEPIKATLTFEDSFKSLHFKKILFAAAMNHRYEGGGFMFAPAADDRDGYLDLCLVDSVPLFRILRVLPTAFKGNHIYHKGVYSYRTKSYSIQTNTPMWLQTDGEILALTKNVTISCVPGILHFYY